MGILDDALPQRYIDFAKAVTSKAGAALHRVRSDRRVALSVVGACAGAALLAPAAAPVFAGIGLATGIARARYNPAARPNSGGIFFIGTDRDTREEIWLTNDDCRQHVLALGETGVGKTEALLGLAENPLTWSSGFLFVDGKGETALFAKVHALARAYGREDDLLVLNFMSGNRDLGKSGGKILSNTLNPFATGSSHSLTTLLVSLMDDTGNDGLMWKGRATALFTGVMQALCWLRDRGDIELNVGTIRDHLDLKAIHALAGPATHPEMPAAIRKAITGYLNGLPGYDADRGFRQPQVTLDQHGYLEMQFNLILGSLADTYGHIFFPATDDVDMYDVIVNRRIVVVMLPALEKAPSEFANLGKIVVAGLKASMGATLASKIQGSWEDIIDSRPTNSSSPFCVILDEMGHYTVEGMALMTAQARSLGINLVLSAKDEGAMKKLSPKEAASIIANTNTKIFMPEARDDVAPDATSRISAKAIRDAKDRTESVVTGDDRVRRVEPHYADASMAGLPLDRAKLSLGANHLVGLVPSPRREGAAS